MNGKSIIWFGMIVGGAIGGLIPNLWGAGFLSLSSTFFTAIGGIIGVYVFFKLTNW